MKKMKPIHILAVAIFVILLVVFGLFIFKKQASAPTDTVQISKEATPNSNKTANPASVNCTEMRGTLTIKTRGDGGEYGLCEFGEGMACEEWALLNDLCPQSGVDISGLESEEQKYCLWLGGNITQTNSTCTLPDENICDTEALYNGICPSS